MQTPHVLFVLLLLAIIAFIVIDAWLTWRRSPQSGWLAAFKGSATILWARFSAFIGALAAFFASLDPSAADAIKSIIEPQYLGAFVVAMAIVNEIARRRTLGK